MSYSQRVLRKTALKRGTPQWKATIRLVLHCTAMQAIADMAAQLGRNAVAAAERFRAV